MWIELQNALTSGVLIGLAQAAGAIVLCKDYDQKQEAWFWPEFAAQRKAFERRTVWGFKERPLFDGKHFLVLQRHAVN